MPILIPEKQFVEWNRLISQCIWQGKRARIRFRTLQLKKEKGNVGLPNLKDYYLAAQLGPFIYLCCPQYNAGCKDIECTSVKGIHLLYVLMDKELQENLMIAQESILYIILDSWKRIIKICHLGNQVKMLRWCAFDSAFKPNKDDGRVKQWIPKGLTSYYTFMQRGVFQSFEYLQRSHGLEKKKFLQVRKKYFYRLDHTLIINY